MKYVTAHYIDARDDIPETVAPLRNGPKLPSDKLTVTIVDYRQRPSLIIGTLTDSTPVPPACSMIDQADYAAKLADWTQWRLTTTAAQAKAAIQQWLDQTAQANGYDDMNSCVSYAGSSVKQWSDDAAAGSAWRDAVWQAAYQWQSDASAQPPDPIPSVCEVVAKMPQPDAYGWTQHAAGANPSGGVTTGSTSSS